MSSSLNHSNTELLAGKSVALLTQGYQSSGGVQTVARWLVRNLESSGLRVDVFNLAASSKDSRSRRIVSPKTWMRNPRIERDITESNVFQVGTQLAEFEPLRYMPNRKLTSLLNTYDIVQVVCGGPALAFATSRSSRPTIIQMATLVELERESINKSKRLHRKIASSIATSAVSQIERWAVNCSSSTLLENQQILELLESRGVTGLVLAPPGVDTELFKPRSGGWSAAGPLLSLGRLGEPRKGLDRLIAAYGEIVRTLPTAPPLILAGRGRLPNTLRKQIDSLGLTHRVDVRENVAQAELVPLLQCASVFIQTSHEEGLGMAAIEAMACGVPVVATETAGTEETVVHGETGYLTTQQEVVAQTSAFAISALKNGFELSKGARCRAVANYSDQTTIARYLDAYVKALYSH